ncbi:VanZ family protein [Ectobacillus antri]|jgi:hypothetical protein|uniref:VanZ family protein n=1 Tax=Ectobacillus antri TaxID=2486280 RepID=A0ABT6H8H0_9BACI|nr:VanZ family protein [Ectobacillus antri]MDG4657759.1 VanZ family protein [Ectobacillus antri]MDG5754766.1 VanZ family protein [Ectobacillus antri]
MNKYMLLIIPFFILANSFTSVNLSVVSSTLVNALLVTLMLYWLLRRTNIICTRDWIIAIAFSIYLPILYSKTLAITLSYAPISYSAEELLVLLATAVNFVPFHGLLDVLRHNPSAYYVIIDSALLFTPLTFAMRYLNWVSTVKRAVWYTFLIIVTIEIIQLVYSLVVLLFGLGVMGHTDIDDVLIHTTGALIGGFCFIAFQTMTAANKQNDLQN